MRTSVEVTRIPVDWWGRPIMRSVEKLQDRGRNVWVAGVNENGLVLVVDADQDTVSVGHLDATGSLGRWECSKQHYDHNTQQFRDRFPMMP